MIAYQTPPSVPVCTGCNYPQQMIFISATTIITAATYAPSAGEIRPQEKTTVTKYMCGNCRRFYEVTRSSPY